MRRSTQTVFKGPADTTRHAVGQSVRHESAGKQVAGEALFTDDYATPANCLHGALVLSSIARGRVTELDLEAVISAPGVVRVIRCEDIPGKNEIGGIFPGDPVLSDGQVKFFAQPLCLVLAKTHQLAWKAAKLARIDYQETGAPVVNYDPQHLERTVCPSAKMGRKYPVSDAEFQQSACVIASDIDVGGQEHFYLEGQITLAEPTEDGGLFLRSSTQSPTDVQKHVAEVLGIPFNLVTVDMRRMGGGFGGKETNAAPWACLAALGAWLTGKAVKLRLPRAIDMQVTGKRHPFHTHYLLGLNEAGIFERANIELNALCGHSADVSSSIMARAMFHCDNAYSLGDVHIDAHHLKTDTVSQTAFRGFGGPQGMMGIEKAIQALSIQTGRDALDLRLANLYRPGRDETPYRMTFEQTETLRDIITTLESRADYRQRRQSLTEWNRHSPVIKKGLALTPVKFGIAFTATHMNQGGALIHIYTDGSVQVTHGGTEMGQGLHTKIQQVVADTLGIPVSRIQLMATRTDKVPNTSPTAASSGTDLNGMAACNAAKTLKQRLLAFAREHYALSDDAEISDGVLHCHDKDIHWDDVVFQAYLARIPLSATGYYRTPKIWYDEEKAEGRPFYYFALGAACSEVSIDTLTGEMQLEQVDILFDAGSSLNPALDIGQIEGGFMQGLGWVTTEELLWDKQGRLMSNSPMNYKIPSIGDYPKTMNIALYDKPNPEWNIYRSKAIGEPPFMLAISVWCAIYDAIAAISEHTVVPNLNLPATGEKILDACGQQLTKTDSDIAKEATDDFSH